MEICKLCEKRIKVSESKSYLLAGKEIGGYIFDAYHLKCACKIKEVDKKINE